MRMIDDFKEVMDNLPPGVFNFFYALVISLLRVLYNEEETKPVKIVLEVLMCGFLGMGAGWATVALGGSVELAHFAAATVGYIGQQEFRRLALKFLDRKLDK
jgi:lambda family phage holin